MKEHESRRERITKQDIEKSELLLDVRVATRSKTAQWRKPIQIVSGNHLKSAAGYLRKGDKRWDRRSELIHVALAEELQRDHQRKERDSRRTTAASAPHELRETRTEQDPDPKRRLYTKAASSTAGSSGQQTCVSRNTSRSSDGD